ncbi:MAG: delta-60 repeat domain-containing protein [Verrucomicrobia bacterium]|nr:delta-60 repeat domain-containing protein [Verrucomicrobiota bacterium]
MQILSAIRRTSCAAFCLIAAATPAVLHAQAWLLDPVVAPAIVNDAPMLLIASYVAATGGQTLAHGNFTHVNGSTAPGLARLGVDGTADAAFASDLSADERVTDVAPLPDGRVVALIGSSVGFAVVTPPQIEPPFPLVPVDPVDPAVITSPGEPDGSGVVVRPVVPVAKFIRLRSDGRKDAAFAALPIDGYPRVARLPDGRVLVWGAFRAIGGQARNGLARLNADGTLDATFAPALSSASLNVSAVAAAADGSLVVSAVAYEPLGRTTYFFTRLLASGAIDARFAPPTTGTSYSLLAVQPDGSVLAGNGNLTRYTPAGVPDRTYAIQIPGLKSISRIAPLPSGRLAVEATVGAANALGAPAVFTLGVNGQLERDLRRVPGAREGHRLLAAFADGRVLVVQGTLVLNSSFYRIPFDATAPADAAIAPIFLGPTLVDPTLAISSADAGALTPFGTTITHRYTGTVNRLETDSTGRVIAAGTFTHIDGQPRAGLARFLASGALDPAYAPSAGELLFAPPDGRMIVRQMTVGPALEDGFHRYVAQIVRLQLDGRVDPSFAFPAKLEAINTNWHAAMPDGRILVSAFEPDSNREENLKLIWLGADGQRLTTLSTVFTRFTRFIILPMDATGAALPADVVMPIPIGGGRPNVIDAVQPLAGGRLLVAGAFSRVDGEARPGLVRLLDDGKPDAAYAPDLATLHYPNAALPLPDGRAFVFGSAITRGRWQAGVLRLRADGSVDPAFQPPPETIASGARRLADGSFFSNGRRYNAEGWPDLNLAPQLRQGSSNGYAATALLAGDGRLWLGGAFDRVNGQPRSALARFAPTEVAGITAGPRSQTVVAGRDAFFQVAIGTTQPAVYRWTRDGATLAGATAAMLRLPAVRVDQAGVYRAIVTIAGQTFTSEPATLTVAPNRSRLINFSARSRVEPGGPPQIAGVVCAGAPPR